MTPHRRACLALVIALPLAAAAQTPARRPPVAFLCGTRPGEIPFEQSTKLELVVNQKAARAFGLRIPASVLASADEVIE